MAWETRKTSEARYYTRSVWEQGRVRRQYFGRGPAAAAAAAEDAERRNAARREREAWEVVQATNARVQQFFAQVDQLMTETLIAAGYHRRSRHAWRRKQP